MKALFTLLTLKVLISYVKGGFKDDLLNLIICGRKNK